MWLGFGHARAGQNRTRDLGESPSRPGTLSSGTHYYIRLRVGETNDWMKSGGDAMASNGGWGTWSVGFYRFAVGGSMLTAPEHLRLVE